jgi:hypothetical protein
MELMDHSYLMYAGVVAVALLLYALALSTLGQGEPPAKPK